MKNIIDALDCTPAITNVSDIPLYKLEVPPSLLANKPPHFIKVIHMPGRKIIQPHNLLIKFQK
ncbi:hypothetical protein AXX04_10715 [Pseudomonas aeruginosa]|nr:hypothetical protein AN455_10810 [Pseudomonas aeruginosa]KRV09008.1 hypothetical protein AN456_11640 [Pseudomonas aeruginosa]RIZ42394.1 hypothetical protein AXX04_10715 [Pseudomonas aeruginosa]WPB09237.1 hypothetical protein [Cloning vector pMA11O14]